MRDNPHENKRKIELNMTNLNEIEKYLGLSIIEVTGQKHPKSSWKKYQTQIAPIQNWYTHYQNYGYVGIITGKVSGHLEVIDIDTKNDIEGNIISEFRELIPDELYKKLLVITTPSGGIHLRYRCPSCTIEPNQILAREKNNAVLIETRGEGGYVCHHLSQYKVNQGIFDILQGECVIPEISRDERELLLRSARSLTRSFPPLKNNRYSNNAINQFNNDLKILEVFKKYDWTIVAESAEKIFLLRPGSEARHSGVYFKETNLFFCFSTSTDFQVGKPYNNFQIVQILENIDDYKQTLKFLSELGFYSDRSSSKKGRITDFEIAEFLNEKGLRYNTFIQEITLDGRLIEEMDNNTLYIELKKHFEREISRSTFENVAKSHLIRKENPIETFIQKYEYRTPQNAIEKWVDCLVLKNPNISKSQVLYFVKKWYVGLIAQCLDGAFPNEFFLAILSTKQGVGKTTLLVKHTIPEELQDYRKEVSISVDDDFKLLMSQSLLLIDDEMDGRTINEDKTFKAILSRRQFPLRRKYDRRMSNLNRRCSFAGCGNQINVVRERQNRRIIPIEIDRVDFEKIKKVDQIDMFMEAYHLFKSGFHYSYDGADAVKIKELTGDYLFKTDLDEIIDESIINPHDEMDEYQISSIDLISNLNDKYPSFSKKISSVSVGKILSDRGIQSKRIGKNKQTVYLISKSSKIVKWNIVSDSFSNTHLLGH
jgi:predicted P-loop ATPase